MGMGPGAECTRTMISVIATICVSLVLLEMVSSAILSAVLPVFSFPVLKVLHNFQYLKLTDTVI